MPFTVTITREPSGSVVARGGDSLAVSLLDHAGFPYINDWHGPRHRLPSSMPPDEQAAIASHAADMLRAARYTVELDPRLDTRSATSTGAQGGLSLGDQILHVTDQIKAAESGAGLANAIDHLLDPEHGILERLREALEAAGEQITDLDDEAYRLADRFGFASEFIAAAWGELLGAQEELRRFADSSQAPSGSRTPSSTVHDSRSAAVSTSPAAAKAPTARDPSVSAPAVTPPAGPPYGSASRNR